MEELKIEYISIDKLTPYDRNTKIHTEKQIEHIENSIAKLGFNDPLGIYGENNIVLEGNGRIEAAKRLKMSELPCVRLDYLSKDEMRAYVIVHNSLNLETGFDDMKLMRELRELQSAFDFGDYGIKLEQFDEKLTSLKKSFLKPYNKVHYLISLDVNLNDKVIELINALQRVEGVEVESSLN